MNKETLIAVLMFSLINIAIADNQINKTQEKVSTMDCKEKIQECGRLMLEEINALPNPVQFERTDINDIISKYIPLNTDETDVRIFCEKNGFSYRLYIPKPDQTWMAEEDRKPHFYARYDWGKTMFTQTHRPTSAGIRFYFSNENKHEKIISDFFAKHSKVINN